MATLSPHSARLIEFAEVRLPHSSGRGMVGYCKLLRSVNPRAMDAFGFQGIFLKPGRRMKLSELRPDDRYPRMPVILECSGPLENRNGPPVYILWRYDQGWNELARAVSRDATWAFDLAPIAHRAITMSQPTIDPAAIAERIEKIFSDELEGLPPEDKARVLNLIHDRMAALSATVDEQSSK